MDFQAAARHLAAEATPCQTPGAQYHTELSDRRVDEAVDLPRDLDLTSQQAETLDTNLHNVMELVLAPYFSTPARTAADLSSDMSMDPTMEDASMPGPHTWSQPTVKTDGSDPASPGGPSPYNGVAPFGHPVTTDQEWLDPQGELPRKYQPMPHVDSPDEDVMTLHSARLHAYEAKVTRFRP